MKDTEIYNKAIDKFGEKSQAFIAIEEMSELIKALCKYYNRSDNSNKEKYKNKIAEEMADVEIMLKQLSLIFNMDYRINKEKEFKINRLEQLLL